MRLVSPVYTLTLAGSLLLTGCFPMYGPYGNPYGAQQYPYGASPYGASPYGVPAGGAYPYGQHGIQTLTPGGTYTPVNPGTSTPGTFNNGTLQPIPGGGGDVTVPGPYNNSGATSPYMSPTSQLAPPNEASVAGFEEPSALPSPTAQLRQINQAQPSAITAQNPDVFSAPATANPAAVSTGFPPPAQPLGSQDPFLSPQPVTAPNANNPWATPSGNSLAPVAPVAPAEEPSQAVDIFGAP